MSDSSPLHLASSPFASSTGQSANGPVTPLSNLRSRSSNFNGSNLHMAGEESFIPGNNPSPTSTFSDSTPASAFRLNDSSHSTFRNVPCSTTPTGTPNRKVIIRSDPSLLTCFDPADRELYDLWAPKK